MTSHTGKQKKYNIHMVNISRIEGCHVIKFVPLIEYFKNPAKYKVGKLVLHFYLFPK